MRSIQSQLTIWLSLGMLLLGVAGGGALLLWIRHAMLHSFDRSLLINAHALQSLVTLRSDGQLDVDVNLRSLSEFTGRSATDFFSFRDDRGVVIATSDPAGPADPSQPQARPWNTRLSNGADARALEVVFEPARDGDDIDGEGVHDAATTPSSRANTGTPSGRIHLIVARDRRPLDAMLLRTTLAVAAGTTLLSLAAVVGAVIIVRRGLGSLRSLTAQVGAIDVTHAGTPLESSGRPAELVPIVGRLNDLRDRMSVALTRERQFTAAISHELRTPIAELRVAADVALREPENFPLARRVAVQAQEIAIQMQTMVATLLSIATAERAAERAPLNAVALRVLIERGINKRSAEFAAGRIIVNDAVADDVAVLANASLLTAIIDNVIGNAVQYAPAGGSLEIKSEASGDAVVLRFENGQCRLNEADVGHVFDPFWRKDGARSDAQHVGLGLTLVRAYCHAIDASADAEVTAQGTFVLTIRLRRAPPTDITSANLHRAHRGIDGRQ